MAGWSFGQMHHQRRLLSRAKAGDRAAQGELCEHLKPYVYTICRSEFQRGDLAGSVDEVQEVLDAVLLTLAAFIARIDSVDLTRRIEPYLGAIARNACSDRIRALRKLPSTQSLSGEFDESGIASRIPEPPAGISSDPEAAFQAGRVADAIDQSLADLRPEWRLLLHLKLWLGVPEPELVEYWPAELKRPSRATLYRWLEKAKVELRTRLIDRGIDDEDLAAYIEWARADCRQGVAR